MSQTSTGLWCLLCCPAPDHRNTVHPPTILSKKDRNTSVLFTCFYYLTGEEKLFDIRGQKTSCSGLGTLGCRTDWLHGQSSQGLSLCPTAFQTASGMREFCLGQKNDKLELHFTKSECLVLDYEGARMKWDRLLSCGIKVQSRWRECSCPMNMQKKKRGFPLLCWCNW